MTVSTWIVTSEAPGDSGVPATTAVDLGTALAAAAHYADAAQSGSSSAAISAASSAASATASASSAAVAQAAAEAVAGVEAGQVVLYTSQSLSASQQSQARANIGLGSVQNLAPADLPISSATFTALSGKADRATSLAGYGITDAAPSSHVGSTDGHPLATTSAAGFMSPVDKINLSTATAFAGTTRIIGGFF